MLRPPPTSTLFPYTTLFRSAERQLAIDSKHLCPSMLAGELAKLRRSARIFITHLKPGEGALTMEQVQQIAGAYAPERSEEHTSELQSRRDLVCRLLLEKKKK